MIDLLKNDLYNIKLEEMYNEDNHEGNYFRRNSDCFSGGDKITINIERPVNHFVTGIKVVLIPFVPEQDIRKDAFFTPLEKRENFEKISSKINYVRTYF